MPIKVAIVDDQPSLRNATKQNLLLFGDLELVFTATDGIDLLNQLKENSIPDVILMDIEMPKMNGIQATFEVTKRFNNEIKIIMLTVFDHDEKIFDAIQAGASGYLMKDEKPIKIMNSIVDVMNGGVPMSLIIAKKTLDLLRRKDIAKTEVSTTNPKPEEFELTKREIEILELISYGKTYNLIAEELFLSTKTIKKHVENIYLKLHVHSKMEAMQMAQRYNWVTIK
jgi:DNA-binding NarL/FixJ family response regulator